MKTLMMIGLIAVAVAAPTAAQDFTWVGPGGVWGTDWATPNNTFSNGWGNSWIWYADPLPYYPGSSDDVLIPTPMSLDVAYGVAARCRNLELSDGASLNLTSTVHHYGDSFVNNGSVTISSNGGFELNGTLDISGNGTIAMSSALFRGWDENIVVFGAGQVLTGQAYIGWEPYGDYEGVRLRNHGELVSTDPTYATDIYGLDCVNDSLIRTAGGDIRIWGDWDNTGGELRADGRIIRFAAHGIHSAHVHGGLLSSANDGTLELNGTASLEDLRIAGLLHIPHYNTGYLRGELVVDGVVQLGRDGGVGSALALLDTTLTLNGVGETRMGASCGYTAEQWPTHNPLLVIGPGHTVHSSGGIFGIEPGFYGDRRLIVENAGALLVDTTAGHAFFWLAGDGLTNTGRFEVAAAPNRIYYHGGYVQTAGSTVVDGTLQLFEGPLDIRGGTLAGRGTVTGSAALDHATVFPGSEGESGTLSLSGNCSLANSTVVWDWDPVFADDRLQVNGTLTATDTVTVRVTELAAAPNKSFDAVVLQYASIVDEAVWVLELPDGWSATLDVGPTQVRLLDINGYTTGAESPPAPRATVLEAAPNPFNPCTTLRYRLDTAGPVRLSVFDLTGRCVRRLVTGDRAAGDHEAVWAGRDEAGRVLASGAYLAVLETASGRATTRLALVK